MIFIADLIACSTCFGHHYAHHQELESIKQMVAACRIRCFGFEVVGMVWCWGLCVRFAGCWASNKICNKNYLLHLVGILFPHVTTTIHVVRIAFYKISLFWNLLTYIKECLVEISLYSGMQIAGYCSGMTGYKITSRTRVVQETVVRYVQTLAAWKTNKKNHLADGETTGPLW